MLNQKNISRIIVILFFLLFMNNSPANCDDDIKKTDFKIIDQIHVNLEQKGENTVLHFIRVKLKDSDNWYQYESRDVNSIALYHSLLLTAFSTGREVKIFYHEGNPKTKLMINSIYIR